MDWRKVKVGEQSTYPLTPCTADVTYGMSRKGIAIRVFQELMQCGHHKEAHEFLSLASQARPPYRTPEDEVVDELEGIIGMYAKLRISDMKGTNEIIHPMPLPERMAQLAALSAMPDEPPAPQPEELLPESFPKAPLPSEIEEPKPTFAVATTREGDTEEKPDLEMKVSTDGNEARKPYTQKKRRRRREMEKLEEGDAETIGVPNVKANIQKSLYDSSGADDEKAS